MSDPSPATIRELRARLDGVTLRDAARLGRRLKKLGGDPGKLDQFTAALAACGLLILWKLVPKAPRRMPHRDVGIDRRQLRATLAPITPTLRGFR